MFTNKNNGYSNHKVLERRKCNVRRKDYNLNQKRKSARSRRIGDRDFGLNLSFLDYPLNVSENLFVLEVETKLEKYIPDVEIADIDFGYEADGSMHPTVILQQIESEDSDNV